MVDRRVVDRRAAAIRVVGPSSDAVARVAFAPHGYLLAHTSNDIARHCFLLCPRPAAHEVRVVATPGRALGEWHLDVASRDRAGLLAAFTGVLTEAGIEVAQAVVATWPDGAALQAYIVRSAQPPDTAALELAFAASLDIPLTSPSIAGADLMFANLEPALYTSCHVVAADQPGLLHALAVAFTTAGVDVHAARVTTVDGLAEDRFDLSDPAGRRLDDVLQDAIRTIVRDGVPVAAFRTRQANRRPQRTAAVTRP